MAQLSTDEQEHNVWQEEQAPDAGEYGLRHVHIAIVGAGFSGLGMAIRLKQRGYHDFVVLERASDVGGTWRDNTYPGCACDIPSFLYSFSFAQNPAWSRMYPQQPELLVYLRSCARRFGIIPHMLWDNELRHAAWDTEAQRWHIMTSQMQLTADILIAGNGPLTEPSIPPIPGLERFEGALFHSARWNHEYDLTNKRVAVIGTGASAIQFVPQIQPQVEKLFLFQRTPPWILPRNDHAIPRWRRLLYRFLPLSQRLVRACIYWQHEFTALGLVYKTDIMRSASKLALAHLRKQVPDPELRAQLTPHYVMGCKRILVSDDFYPALTQPNVTLVISGIHEVRAHSIVTTDGNEHKVDAIICGTGFHVAETDFHRTIHGSNGQSLLDAWHNPEIGGAYYGTTVPGFPNLFLLIGPNTGLGHNSMVYMIESQLTYILDCLRMMRQRQVQAVDVRPAVQTAFNQEIQRRMQKTVWTSGCASWYLDANGRNTTLWPGFTFEYRHKLRHFDVEHYTLFINNHDGQNASVSHHSSLPEKKEENMKSERAGMATWHSVLQSRVLVVGAAGAIGSGVAQALRERGARVIGVDLVGGENILAADIRDDEAVRDTVQRAITDLGGLDVLINTAGIGLIQDAGRPPDESVRKTIDINLLGPWRVTGYALPELIRARGRVINVASGLAFATVPFAAAYAASKRALSAWADTLRIEYGSKIGVTTVYPGYIRTPIHVHAEAANLSLSGLVNEEPLEAVVETIIKACTGRPRRDITTTHQGAVGIGLARHFPALVDRFILSRMRQLQKRKRYAQAPLASGMLERMGWTGEAITQKK